MKLLKILMLTATLACLFSCTKTAEEEVSSNEMVGNWIINEITYIGKTTSTSTGERVEGTFAGMGKDMNLEISLTEVPNEYYSSGEYVIDLTTTIDGTSNSTDMKVPGFNGIGSWSFDGNYIVFTNNKGEESMVKVIESSESILIFEQKYTETETDQGATTTNEIEATFTFLKK